ncbi:hypothetical protein FISHEDRAFT_50220 [Fistulina hepatica ATCC 64428]|uniref:Transmembrane protein n=1 Tax=Fistulina hepatica ATCC 64428 TaxID=1128425 RepID=A0A0D7A500_9AGAR|nr:hypothetical protein FISHEDRAFT_50220 [Fistulina hepatica ATCC 64428]
MAGSTSDSLSHIHTHTRPPWPSLYNPGLELLNVAGGEPEARGGVYLSKANDVFVFTLYWTFIFYIPAFIFCGLYAFFNITFPPANHNDDYPRYDSVPEPAYSLPLLRISSAATQHTSSAEFYQSPQRYQSPKMNERRSRVTFGLLILLLFFLSSLAGAVITSLVVGYVLAGLYSAAKYHLSTWMPFVFSALAVCISMTSIWPSIIDII